MKKNYFLIICLVFLMLSIQNTFALNVSSDSYSIGVFGEGVASSSNLSSSSYEAEAVVVVSYPGTRGVESGVYVANIGFFENTTHTKTISISSYSISSKNANIGTTIKLSISAVNSQAVWAKITSPNGQVQTLNLINNAEVSYLPSPSVVGRYNVTFYANNSIGSIATAIDYFNFIETSSSSGNSGGGGGSTTVKIEKCTYNWDCTPWGLCLNGKQQRKCKNIGTCEGIESKPIEKTECSSALFDLNITLNNLEKLNNESLSFKVNLEEQKGAEKFDALIKYSLLNEENHELFSQIETKAVENKTNYDKELNDLNLSCGNYTVRTEVLYGNLQRAMAEQTIEVSENCAYASPQSIPSSELIPTMSNVLIIGIALLLLWIILFVFLTKPSRKSSSYPIPKRTLQDNIKSEMPIFSSKTNKEMPERKIITPEKTIKQNISSEFSSSKVNIEGEDYLEIKPTNYKPIKEKKPQKNELKPFFLKGLFSKIFGEKLVPSKDSLSFLKNKQVYLENGHHIGKVEEIFLGENRIESLKIRLTKEYKNISKKGILLNYRLVKSVGEIIILDLSVSNMFNK